MQVKRGLVEWRMRAKAESRRRRLQKQCAGGWRRARMI